MSADKLKFCIGAVMVAAPFALIAYGNGGWPAIGAVVAVSAGFGSIVYGLKFMVDP